MMDRLDAMALFVTAVDEGSLAAAARRHGRSPAAVTRAVAMLEADAGESLLLRSTRRLALTPEGEHRLAVWRDVLNRLGEAGSDDQNKTLRGSLVLTAPELFGRLEVMPILNSFLMARPQVSARVLLLNRVVDLVGEGIDIAVRLGPLPDSALKAVKVGEVRILVCGSPDYLARAGMPNTPQDLVHHDCIGLNPSGHWELWPFAFSTESPSRLRSVRVPTRLSINHAGAAIDAALQGQGLVRVRSYQVAEHLEAGRLVTVLDGNEPPPEPVHLVFHPERARLGPARDFIEQATLDLRKALRP